MENGTAATALSDKNFEAASLMASITVNDMATSVAWYRDALGFEVGQQFERDGRVAATQISAGAVRLLLNQEDGAKGADRKKGQGISLQFSTSQNVDAIADPLLEPPGIRSGSHPSCCQPSTPNRLTFY